MTNYCSDARLKSSFAWWINDRRLVPEFHVHMQIKLIFKFCNYTITSELYQRRSFTDLQSKSIKMFWRLDPLGSCSVLSAPSYQPICGFGRLRRGKGAPTTVSAVWLLPPFVCVCVCLFYRTVSNTDTARITKNDRKINVPRWVVETLYFGGQKVKVTSHKTLPVWCSGLFL